jgi:hypothetical protein
MVSQEEIKKLIDKVKKIEKGEKLDLSSGEDLSVAVMNLVSIEEHLFFSGAKTGKEKYFDLLNQIRQMRKELLKQLIKDYEGEVWCISKHLLAASMRLMEVGTKALTQGQKKEAQEMFGKAYNLYNLFWGLNLGLVKKGQGIKENIKSLNFISDDPKPKVKATAGFLAKLGEIVQKVVDCCKE